MSNIYKQRQEYVKKPDRNNFDLNFTNNFSTRLGRIIPVMCKETVPGDSFHISASVGLRALPMVFPIQTDVTAELEFYYIPNRILWKDFKDFIGRTKDNLVHPYISIPYTRASEIGTGTLADYLGVPTTYAGAYGGVFSLGLSYGFTIDSAHAVLSDVTSTEFEHDDSFLTSSVSVTSTSVHSQHPFYKLYYIFPDLLSNDRIFVPNSSPIDFYASHFQNTRIFYGLFTKPFNYTPTRIEFNNNENLPSGDFPIFIRLYGVHRDNSNNLTDVDSPYIGTIADGLMLHIDTQSNECYIALDQTRQDYITSKLSQYGELRMYIFQTKDQYNTNDQILFDYINSTDTNPHFFSPILIHTDESIVGDVSPELNPFVIQPGEQYPAIRLNALPFRAYESIYNTYKRNNFINPLRINGEVEYNEVVTNRAQGADDITPLNLVNRNYELDYLTDCRTSPQQGIAPLVGVTNNGIFEFQDTNTGQTYSLKPILNDDGDTIAGIEEYDEGIPTGSIEQLQQMINYGISISTFRATNALQVWLETNIRRGFKYEDQMLSHFGVNVTKLELQEPIFIGGFTRRIEVQEVTAMASSDGINLGDYAGKAGLFTQQKHDINYHCQEHGFIIATLTIVPIPSYSQLLPKLFLKSNALDYYFKEFSHLSMQPITYNEVCPIQSYIAGDDLNDVFGYQRPNYDLIANVDEAHGLMRTKFQNYLLTRVFGSRPQLSQSFIEVKPGDITSPFVDANTDEDTFLGQIFFEIDAKRPIPRIAIARIEP